MASTSRDSRACRLFEVDRGVEVSVQDRAAAFALLPLAHRQREIVGGPAILASTTIDTNHLPAVLLTVQDAGRISYELAEQQRTGPVHMT